MAMWNRHTRARQKDAQAIRRVGSYVAGMLAATRGTAIDECPYKRTSQKRTAWLKGFSDGKKS